jgi:hypothetical protein
MAEALALGPNARTPVDIAAIDPGDNHPKIQGGAFRSRGDAMK